MKDNKQRFLIMFARWAAQCAGWQAWDQAAHQRSQCTVVHTRNRQQVSWRTVLVFWSSLGYFNVLYKRQTCFKVIKEPLAKINRNKSPNSLQNYMVLVCFSFS